MIIAALALGAFVAYLLVGLGTFKIMVVTKVYEDINYEEDKGYIGATVLLWPIVWVVAIPVSVCHGVGWVLVKGVQALGDLAGRLL